MDDDPFDPNVVATVTTVGADTPDPNPEEFTPGVVRLLILPDMPRPEGDYYLTRILAPREANPTDLPTFEAELAGPPGLEKRVRNWLEPRSMLTAALKVDSPKVIWVSADVKVKTRLGFDPTVVVKDMKSALYRWLHPVHGGDDHKGWPFGRDVTVDKVYVLALGVVGVEYAIGVRLTVLRLNSSQGKWEYGAPYRDVDGVFRYDRVPVRADEVVHSALHEVNIISGKPTTSRTSAAATAGSAAEASTRSGGAKP